jgi:UDP-N-acetylmuramoylalanine-D-glutamate ligase
MAQVIVVGGGLAGLSAAHTLLERGANVLLLDKQGYALISMMAVELLTGIAVSWAGTLPKLPLVSTEPEHRPSKPSVSRITPRFFSTTPRNLCVISLLLCTPQYLQFEHRLVNSLAMT